MKRTKKRLYLAAWVITILVLLLTGCSQTAPASPTAAPKPAAQPTAAQPAAQPTAAAAPAAAQPTAVPAATKPAAATTAAPVTQPTGDLKVGITSFNGQILDPMMMNNATMRIIGGAMFDSLVGYSPEGVPGPGIAEKWDMTPDGKVWTFYIRKGVKFHDGSDLTAADVKFSIERYMAPESVATDKAALGALIDRIDVKDPYTMVINLKAPDSEHWHWYTLQASGPSLIVPKAYIEKVGPQGFRDKIVGSGPWKVVSWKPGVELNLEAVPGHWRQTPAFKNLKVLAIPELTTRMNMVKTGELDVAEAVPEIAADLKAANLKIVSVEASRTGTISLWPDFSGKQKLPINDVRVRRALLLAINRPELSQTLFAGLARPNVMPMIAQTSMYFDGNVLKADPYDPAEAKKLIADAGYPNGFSINLYATGLSSWSNSLTQAIGGYWQKVGVNAKVITQDYATVRPKITPNVAEDFMGSAMGQVGPPYPHFGLKTVYSQSKGMIKATSNPELDALIDKAEATLDPNERKKLGVQAAVLAKKEYGYNGILDVNDVLAVGKNVGVWKPVQGWYILGSELEKIPHAQ